MTRSSNVPLAVLPLLLVLRPEELVVPKSPPAALS
jgi:hypothetical protein